MKLTNLLFLLAMMAIGISISCEPAIPEFPDEAMEAYRPIYANSQQLTISKESGRDINLAGKIFVYGNVLLVNEVNQGIHVFDNTDPKKPINLFFISIPGNTDMSFDDGLLYANNMSDLVTIKVSLDDFEVTQRFEGLFLDDNEYKYPPGHDVYFSCINPERGRVIGWEKDIIQSPDCYKR
ncbi:hypothetical protein [Marinoscillum pacificum]|uniref:hypothetical protein n=1 Tax=Marinoscillum pacificum TaxID=392723 RepID=UPI0021570E5D|nr:hypothetical protein [Marinoscillum pacificum]